MAWDLDSDLAQMSIMKELICSECKLYLSFPPIVLKKNGESLCGRCADPELIGKSLIRNRIYEDICCFVMKFLWHCRYEDLGCNVELPWGRMKKHEETCIYKYRECPLVHLKRCPWKGCIAFLLHHYFQDHKHDILRHPAIMSDPHFTIQRWQTSKYHKIIHAFGEMFLVQLEYKANGDQLLHAVHFADCDAVAVAACYKYSIQMGTSNRTAMITRSFEVFTNKWHKLHDLEDIAHVMEIDKTNKICINFVIEMN